MKQHLQSTFNTRQFMLSNSYELFYYNDYDLSLVPVHRHDYYEFYFFLEGNVEIIVEQKQYPISFGDFLLIPPGTSHHPSFLSQDKPYRRFVLWVAKEYYKSLTKVSKSYLYLPDYVESTKEYLFHNDTITFNTIQSMLFRLIEETNNSRFGKEAEVSLQLNCLLLHLNRIVYEQKHNQSTHTGQELFVNICNYISDNLENDLSLEQLAKYFYVSKFYISHSFKEKMGLSLHQYIIKKRLNAGKDAILSSVPISKIYSRYGFHDYSSFFRAFKREYGISPNEYRELYQIPEIK
jgi:AraC-like DNA-binding protein